MLQQFYYPGKLQEQAILYKLTVFSRVLSRPDVQGLKLMKFLEWCTEQLATADSMHPSLASLVCM